MSVPFNPTRNATAGSTAAPTTSNLTTTGQCAINAYTGTYYMRKEDATISDIVGDRLSGFRNRLINGNMAIDQRNAGASLTPTASAYSVDRWQATVNQSSKFSIQQNAGSVTPPVGYKNYLGVTSLSAYSVLSTDYFVLTQLIEGYNIADLGFGAAGASPISVSFWVRSSLTGTFGGAIQNAGGGRSYPFSYTIIAANTWEQKSITILGDTSGTWLTDTSAGIVVRFGLGAGSTYSGTAGTWASANTLTSTGTVSVVGTNAATFYITGVQLEKGLVPTPFEVRSYGTEFALCQRYYQVIGGAINNFGIQGYQNAGQGVSSTVPLAVVMRATPTGVMPTFTNTNTVGATINAISTNCFLMVAVATILGSVSSINTAAGVASFTSEL